MDAQKGIENLRKQHKYDRKVLPNFLKYFGKIKSVSDYEEYRKSNIYIPLVEWVIQVIIIRPVLIFFTTLCLSAGLVLKPHNLFFLAEGISLFWYLFIELKQDLWRK